jgi:BirA family biotin operon repressor/biotin-[acetyl-CoA-carboxylase] ligase
MPIRSEHSEPAGADPGSASPVGPVVVRFEAIVSTSLHARQLIATGQTPARPTLFVAERQTGGVGRFGRAFASPPGGLWFTLCWPLAEPRREAALGLGSLGVRIGWACLMAVRGAMARAGADAERAGFKWPNDVRVDGRKVLGVLTELVGQGPGRALLVGVGCNANCTLAALPPELRNTAGTLRDLCGSGDRPGEIDLEALRQELVEYLMAALASPTLSAEQHAVLERNLALRGAAVVGQDESGAALAGTLAGLSPSGKPLIRLSDGRVVPAEQMSYAEGAG